MSHDFQFCWRNVRTDVLSLELNFYKCMVPFFPLAAPKVASQVFELCFGSIEERPLLVWVMLILFYLSLKCDRRRGVAK